MRTQIEASSRLKTREPARMRKDQPLALDVQLRDLARTEISLLSLRAFLSMSSQSIVSTFLRGSTVRSAPSRCEKCHRTRHPLSVAENFIDQARLARAVRTGQDDEGICSPETEN